MNHQPTTRKPTALVTGGGGFLGGAIVRRLMARGDRAASFSRGDYPELEKMGVEQIRGDIADPEAVDDAIRGRDVVFHVAAKAGVWGPYEEYLRANVTGSENIIAACKKHGVSRLVYTSSPSVVFHDSDMEGVDESVPYPDRYHAPYPETKARAERRVVKARDDTLRTIILRPHLIWGPGDNHLVPRIIARARRLRIVGDGANKVDTVYIDNAADAHLLAADRLAENPALSGNIYFISNDEPINLWKMVNGILNAAGLPPVKRSVPAKAAWLVGAVLESAYKFFRIKSEPQMTRFVARELATSHWFDITAAKKDLGYTPRVSTEEGLQRLADWLKNKKTGNIEK